MRCASTVHSRAHGGISGFRTAYPDRTFYRGSTFRPDFLKYADGANCTIVALNALNAPPNAPQRYRDLDASLRATLKEYTEVLASGRDAVTQRNTSGYRDWWDATDELEARIAAALTAAQN